MISVDKLHPHPNNPRKDLGDLSELAESIKQSGIFQNLTAIPWFSSITGVGCDDPKQQEEVGYTVIIGHRRLAAAKLAGLKEVPCAIVEMDQKTQVATMLLENMQRNDLTVYEQAEGFQMMMDLGETLKDISEKTGFSETTVRRSTNLLKLDKDKFKKSIDRGATLMDYAELEKIKDIDTRNKVLESIGTPNFRYQLQIAIETERREEFFEKAVEFLKTFAAKAGVTNDLIYVSSINFDKDLVKPDDAGETKYYYKENGTYLYLYKEGKAQQSKPYEPSPKEKERQERHSKLDELWNMTKKLRFDFVENLAYAKIKKNMDKVSMFVVYAINLSNYFNSESLCNILNIDDEIEEFEYIEPHIKEPEKAMFLWCYKEVEDESGKPFDWQGKFSESKELNRIYEFLESFGYEISDEEKALCDGTHELYWRDEE